MLEQGSEHGPFGSTSMERLEHGVDELARGLGVERRQLQLRQSLGVGQRRETLEEGLAGGEQHGQGHGLP